MFEVVYVSRAHSRWTDDFIFNTYEDAKGYLLEKGFKKAANGFLSDWFSTPQAFILPKKVYKG